MAYIVVARIVMAHIVMAHCASFTATNPAPVLDQSAKTGKPRPCCPEKSAVSLETVLLGFERLDLENKSLDFSLETGLNLKAKNRKAVLA